MQKIADYIRNACVGFEHDPPTSDFQRGYLAALIETGRAMKLSLPFEQWDRVLTSSKRGNAVIDKGSVKKGDILIADGEFDCLSDREECVVHEDEDGLFVFCDHNGTKTRHYLEGQEGYTPETEGKYVGFWKKS